MNTTNAIEDDRGGEISQADEIFENGQQLAAIQDDDEWLIQFSAESPHTNGNDSEPKQNNLLLDLISSISNNIEQLKILVEDLKDDDPIKIFIKKFE